MEGIALEGTNIHGRKDYRVSSRGLVYYFEYFVPRNLDKIVLSHPNNVMFEVFIYPYFERQTLKDVSYNLSRLLGSYLEEVSALTRYWLTPVFLRAYDYDTTKSSTEQIFSTGELPPVRILAFELNCSISSFLFRVATMKEELISWTRIEPYHQDEEKERLKTVRQLAGDRKFMRALKQAERDFRKGYERLIKLEATIRHTEIP